MSGRHALVQRLVELSPAQLGGLVLLGVGAPLVGSLATAPAVDGLLYGISGLWAALSGGALWVRARVDRLPLQLAGRALSGRVNGHRVLRFRVRLGHGRAMREAVAVVRFLPQDGAPVELGTAHAPGEVIVGPWTICLPDPEGLSEQPGHFEVEVRALERDHSWEARSHIASEQVQEGRFGAGMRRRGGRLRWDDASWDQNLRGSS